MKQTPAKNRGLPLNTTAQVRRRTVAEAMGLYPEILYRPKFGKKPDTNRKNS